MKARVQTAFRYFRLDNIAVDVKVGEIVEAEDIPPTQRSDRFMAGHLVAVTEKAHSPEGKPVGAEPQEIARVKAVAPKGKK